MFRLCSHSVLLEYISSGNILYIGILPELQILFSLQVWSCWKICCYFLRFSSWSRLVIFLNKKKIKKLKNHLWAKVDLCVKFGIASCFTVMMRHLYRDYNFIYICIDCWFFLVQWSLDGASSGAFSASRRVGGDSMYLVWVSVTLFAGLMLVFCKTWALRHACGHRELVTTGGSKRSNPRQEGDLQGNTSPALRIRFTIALGDQGIAHLRHSPTSLLTPCDQVHWEDCLGTIHSSLPHTSSGVKTMLIFMHFICDMYTPSLQTSSMNRLWLKLCGKCPGVKQQGTA